MKGLLKDKCESCNSDYKLHLIQKLKFVEIIDKFKQENYGKIYTKVLWENFFKQHQKYKTLCAECAYIHNMRKVREPETLNKLTVLDKNMIIKRVTKKKKYNKKSNFMILYMWLINARTSLLIRKAKNINKI